MTNSAVKRFIVHRLGFCKEIPRCYEDGDKHYPILVTEADDPSNINWENLHVTDNKKTCIRACLSIFNITVLALCFFGIFKLMDSKDHNKGSGTGYDKLWT